MSVGQVCSLGGPLTVGGGLLCLDLVLLLDTCIGRRELLSTLLRDEHLSKDEMCLNVSLSIFI
jgi:hypothetical protein